jgi:zinc transport system substrate-binding protein
LSLDEAYTSELANATRDEIIVTHSAFGYLAHDYGFEQLGVIGISADQQPSASGLGDLGDRMEDQGIFTIFIDPVYSDDYAQALKRELEARTGVDVTVLDLFPLTGPSGGQDLVDLMEKNRESLAIGLMVAP